MDCVFINEYWTHMLLSYGSIVLFVLLALGIIALPIPDETLLVFSGALMAKGVLLIPFTFIAALAGSISGITISYLLGRTGGTFLVNKYGGTIGITPDKMQKAHDWFQRYGKWSLSFGYFIPGVRHFTGLTAGTSGLEFKDFSVFAYSGALVWVTTFLTIGYFFGNICFSFLETIDGTTVLVIGSLIMLAVAGAAYNKYMKTNK